MTFDKIRLRRTGQPPLAFQGELVSYAGGRLDKPRERSRWHEIGIWRAVEGDYVVKVSYLSTWPGEAPLETVETRSDAHGVIELLSNFDCTAPVKGFPLQPEFAARQQQLLAEIRAAYVQVVGAVLDHDDFADAL